MTSPLFILPNGQSVWAGDQVRLKDGAITTVQSLSPAVWYPNLTPSMVWHTGGACSIEQIQEVIN